MEHGFVKVAAAIPSVRVADCLYNAAQLKELIQKASEAGVQLIAFPELSITSYSCLDFAFVQTGELKSGVKVAEIHFTFVKSIPNPTFNSHTLH